MPPLTLCASPAKAGVQLERLQLAGYARSYCNLPNWAPAFAGEGNIQ